MFEQVKLCFCYLHNVIIAVMGHGSITRISHAIILQKKILMFANKKWYEEALFPTLTWPSGFKRRFFLTTMITRT